MSRYNFKEAEAKWQQAWEQQGTFTVTEDPQREKYYVLEMFPYPSGRIHMGHVRNYTLGDVVARFKRAQGLNVLHPMGWDAFGLPAENAAIQNDTHPAIWTEHNIATMKAQLKTMGLSYDWSREIATCEPAYYKHEQKCSWISLRLGLPTRKNLGSTGILLKTPCSPTSKLSTARAGGPARLWSKTAVAVVLKVTQYGDDLLQELKTLDRWPEKVRIMQENWIGRSEGARVFLNVPIAMKPWKSTPHGPTRFLARRSWPSPPITRLR